MRFISAALRQPMRQSTLTQSLVGGIGNGALAMQLLSTPSVAVRCYSWHPPIPKSLEHPNWSGQNGIITAHVHGGGLPHYPDKMEKKITLAITNH